MKGLLKSFNYDKHFGFLSTDDPKVDCFVHRDVFYACGIMHPVAGEVYEYEAQPSTRKRGKIQACRVWRVEGAEAEIELAWLATVSSCFSYLISQVALWLTIRAGRPPTVS
jgi:cold shock CspA family protein